ncbi:MAG: diguanylate cyclase [Eubacteriales bacterium]|nr:diguanylate cyclase [Eubacteriales bacterium]MDD3881049.1 diguanylate cyclase [Eubacteriales bacterium]MDD4511882.1 diguanylate cyclase [Eubacteriales bacterium]
MKNQKANTGEKTAHGARIPKILVAPILSFLLIFASIAFTGVGNVRHASETAREVLMASAKEQSSVLSATWRGQVDTLAAVAIELAEYDEINMEAALKRLLRLQREGDYSRLMFSLGDGIAHSADGSVFDISSRGYLKRAMSGKWAVERIPEGMDGTGSFIALAVPIIKDDKIIGAVEGIYGEERLSKLIIPEVFGGEAYSVICREDGTVSIETENPSFGGENMLAVIEEAMNGRQGSFSAIREDVASGRQGTFTVRLSGRKLYAAYVPLDSRSAGGERLMLFSFVPAAQVDAPAIRQTYYNVLMLITALVGGAITFIWLLRHQKKTELRLREERDHLMVIEKQNRITMEKSGLIMARYDLKTGTVCGESALVSALGYQSGVMHTPDSFISGGVVAPESIEELRKFYANLRAGKLGTAVVSLKTPDSGFRWFSIDASFAEDSEGKPYQAILIMRDVTEKQEKEALYQNWLKTIRQKDVRSYSLFRCNLSKGDSFSASEGSLLTICFSPGPHTFNERTDEYAGRFVHIDDYDAYKALLNSENLLASYYRGKTKHTMEYRENTGAEKYRWLRVTIETLKYPVGDDIEVLLMYDDIDEKKRAELKEKEKASIDPMTGVLNRSAFVERLSAVFTDKEKTSYAVILIDLDGFKQINDSFGHAVGDQALYEVGQSLLSVVSSGDILGRIGGDEFMIFARGIESQAVAEKRAIQIQALLRRAYSLDVNLSASIGIAFYPSDGSDFKTLYRNADIALYAAKQSGRDAFSFYIGENPPNRQSAISPATQLYRGSEKRRIIVYEKDEEVIDEITGLYADNYKIEICEDERELLYRLRKYGMAISAVLLSLDVQDTDGFSLLADLRRNDTSGSVPIVVISAERGQCVAALRCGARDYIPKPINRDVLRARVEAAIAQVDNERLRAQNAYLQTQSGERSKYRTVFENTGTLVVEYDWLTGAFTYDPDMSQKICGRYDSRSLWMILLSDMVADAMDVKRLQESVHDLATDRKAQSAKKDVRLKTPDGSRHWFAVTMFKRINELKLTSRIIMTFADINDNVLTEDRLRYQAEHDALTGLYNRSAFLAAAEMVIRTGSENTYVLMCTDIDNFRFINERFGRDEGDRLLKYSAEKLRTHTESVNGLAGRLSNDVFAILVRNTPTVFTTAEQIILNFFKDYPLKTNLTCRVGAYVINDKEMTVDTMLDHAATAKESIRGKYGKRLALFDESMNEQALLEKDIADHMEAALAEKQFEVYIQPQFHHASGAIVGAEALVRWLRPDRGLVSPAAFIPVFEKNGFIVKLDEYVWEKTAELMSEWIRKGMNVVPVSVNVSREDTKDSELCARLRRIVEKHSIPKDFFRIEITESLFADDAERLRTVVDELHEAGFLVEMDDFGSGYSSFNILKDIPVDILKLDMRFLSGEDNLGRGGMIVGAVLRMSRWLGIPVIAEGVEKKHQADSLLSVGCPTIQGYIYEKPMPAEEYAKRFLESNAARALPENNIETQLDTHSFWDSTSLDSRLFNLYIGPAAVVEYHMGEYEFLRMNKRFMDLMMIDDNAAMPACLLMRFSQEDRPAIKSAVLSLIETGKETSFSARAHLSDGSEKRLSVALRLIAKSEDRALIFAALDK